MKSLAQAVTVIVYFSFFAYTIVAGTYGLDIFLSEFCIILFVSSVILVTVVVLIKYLNKIMEEL